MLSGAGVVKGRKKTDTFDAQKIFVHANYDMVVEKIGTDFVCKLTDEERNGATLVVSKEAPIYPVTLNSAGAQADYLSAVTETEVGTLSEDGAFTALAEFTAEVAKKSETELLTDTTGYLKGNGEIVAPGKTLVFKLGKDTPGDDRQDAPVAEGDTVRIDCYEMHDEGAYEMQIDASTFAGYYYIEASTLFRDEETGEDMPAEFVIPRGKIQSNFTFTMANSGDPSTFTFTIDCFPAFTKFNRKKKLMAALQVVGNTDTSHNYKNEQVIGHKGRTSDKDVDGWYKKSIFDQDVSGE